MPIDWSADGLAKTVNIRLCGDIAEQECLALVRGVVMVTNTFGDFAVRVDARPLRSLPDYPGLVRLAHEIARITTAPHTPIAMLAAAEGAAYGQMRQLTTLLAELGLPAEMFTDDSRADAWLAPAKAV